MEGPHVDDEALLRRAGRGDAAAFALLHERLAPMVLLRLRRRCADPDVVADVLQETFTAAWRGARSFDGGGEVAAWVWTIAARRLVDAYRRAAARRRPLAQVEHAPSAENQVMDGLLGGPLEAAVRDLAPELRAVLEATVLDGLSTREAAVALGVPQGTVKSRAMRARTALRQALS